MHWVESCQCGEVIICLASLSLLSQVSRTCIYTSSHGGSNLNKTVSLWMRAECIVGVWFIFLHRSDWVYMWLGIQCRCLHATHNVCNVCVEQWLLQLCPCRFLCTSGNNSHSPSIRHKHFLLLWRIIAEMGSWKLRVERRLWRKVVENEGNKNEHNRKQRKLC